MSETSLRIGMVCYPTYGGSGAVATELGRLLARRGHRIHFISYARPFRLAGDFHPNIVHHEIGSEYYPLFQGQLYTIAAAVKMHDIVRHIGLDLLHVHYALPHAISAWMAMEMLGEERRVPTLTTLHGTDITLVGSRPSFAPAVKLGLDKSGALTCVSQWLARHTCERFANCGRLRVIYNFVDPEVFTPDNHACNRRHFADDNEKILMHISNFRPVKRVTDVVETFARIAARTPARLVMIGDGPDREKAVLLAEKLGVTDRVAMLGNQPGVNHFLPMADLFLFPSDGESFGLAALEAMACEVPVVGADAGGLPEVVAHGECGVLCPVGDVECLAEESLRILTDADLGRRMGRAGRRRAIERFAARSIVPQYEELYRRLVSGDAMPSPCSDSLASFLPEVELTE
ncbi:MAG: N-acetyl-alpha-D-glucosaminyl L-malate synthase BshA [bacterium]|nr:N-acetyl-alpha-D-glucosaminyl L-malate synthase BshA [bacterium]